MELVPLLITVASAPGVGGVAAVMIRESMLTTRLRMRLQHYRHLHDHPVARDQKPDPVELTKAAGEG